MIWSKACLCAVLAGGVSSVVGFAHAEEPAQVVAADVAVQQREARGVVEAIDSQARVVTLKGDQGWSLDIPAGPEVRNFDQLKVGDRVAIVYRSALALALKKGGDSVRKDVEKTIQAAPGAGGKPGVLETRIRTVVSNVVALDRAKGVATLEGPHGRVLDVAARDPRLLADVEVGNQVVAVITESAAVEIRPAP